jgi:hypothetical protein
MGVGHLASLLVCVLALNSVGIAPAQLLPRRHGHSRPETHPRAQLLQSEALNGKSGRKSAITGISALIRPQYMVYFELPISAFPPCGL